MFIFGLIGLHANFSFRESFLFGSLISATDPVCVLTAFKNFNVDANFYQIIFGESILNDAVAIVFYDTVGNFKLGENVGLSILISTFEFIGILIASFLLGYFIGYLTAFVSFFIHLLVG